MWAVLDATLLLSIPPCGQCGARPKYPHMPHFTDGQVEAQRGHGFVMGTDGQPTSPW